MMDTRSFIWAWCLFSDAAAKIVIFSGILVLGVAFGEKSYKIGSESNRIWGEAPAGLLNLGHASRGNYSKIKFKINRASR